MPDTSSLRSTKGIPATPLRHRRSPHRASDGGSEGMASPDPCNIKIELKTETDDINIDSFPTEVCEME